MREWNRNDTAHTHPLPFLTWHDFWHIDGYGHGTQLQDLYNRWERVAGTEGSTTTTSMWDVEGRWRWTGKRLWWDRAKIHRLRLTGMGSTSLRQQINGSLIRSWGWIFGPTNPIEYGLPKAPCPMTTFGFYCLN